MASKNIHIMKGGDTLWDVAKEYLGDGTKWRELAAINNIQDETKIPIGTEIALDKSSATATVSAGKPTITAFGLNTTNSKELVATWTWTNLGQTESFVVLWRYSTGFKDSKGNIVWFGSESTITVPKNDRNPSTVSTFTIPDNARSVKFKVKPISEKKDGTETLYFTASWSTEKTYTNQTPLTTPGTPSIEIKDTKLSVELTNIDISGASHIKFEIVKDNQPTVYKSNTIKIVTGRAAWTTDIVLGSEYKVRCRATDGDDLVSEWSDYSNNVGTQPSAPTSILPPKATSSTSILLGWGMSPTAKSYDIEYATNKNYFDNTDQTTTKSGVEQTSFEFIGLDSGFEYFFRVRAVNDDGESSWTPIVSVIIGKDPAAPTTWSSTTTAITGEEITLYWVHNAEDGSSQTVAIVEIYCNNSLVFDQLIRNTTNEDEKDKTKYVVIDTDNGLFKWVDDTGDKTASWPAELPLKEGCKITWRVCTKGVTPNMGDWSVMRTVDIYAPPSLELTITDGNKNELAVIESFPFYIYGLAGPSTQVPIGYHVAITANESYETVDNIGNEKFINVGDSVYEKHFDISTSLLIEMSPANVDLENNMTYTVTVIVSMNSGLTTEASKEFSVGWVETAYNPNAEIGVNRNDYTATILPYCDTRKSVYRKVELIAGAYTTTNTTFDGVYGQAIPGVTLPTGELVYEGVSDTGEECMYIFDTQITLVDTAYLSVYRREYDGSFTELATGLDGARKITVTDPHPALDFARYRIVATDKATGAVSYTDLPGYPVGGDSVIIQWDDEWTEFETNGNDDPVQPPWSGSLLAIPYNIDVSDSNDVDVSFVEYIGRKHPVSYHGTQLGVRSTWNMQIRKDDKETLYGLRRLAVWMGDVYVREPSGSGYWASVSVSFSQKHKELTIPVTLDITRVEGGV